jgi:DNA-binding NtrC family response regulator
MTDTAAVRESGRRRHEEDRPAPEAADLTADLPQTARQSVAILIVDDEHTLRESCASVLRAEGFSVSVCGRGDEARQMLRRRAFDIVLLDLYMSQVPGMELLEVCLEANPDTLVVVMTGNPSVETSIATLRAGAWDYLPKPFSAPQLQTLLGRAAHTVLERRERRQQEEKLRERFAHSDKVTLLGNAPSFQKVIDLARRVAPTDASVFITGDSGSGKEMIAQFIHYHSRRATRPIVAINCAALPEALLESEMFGHVKGSFTGAVADKEGLLETANGGTMFLDELIEMSPAIQAKLLRVIQDGTIRRVGSSKIDAVVNVRFIAATNRDPQQAVEEGQLRRDLFYRLRVVPIHVPPLRDRPEDIPILARHFLAEFWKLHRGRSAPPPFFSDDAMRALQSRPWLGNVRELQNVIEHAVVLLEAGSEIRPDDIPSIDGPEPSPGTAASLLTAGIFEEKYHDARERVIAQFEREYLTWLVRRAGGNMSKAARIAGVDRTTLYRLSEKHGLERSEIAGPVEGREDR